MHRGGPGFLPHLFSGCLADGFKRTVADYLRRLRKNLPMRFMPKNIMTLSMPWLMNSSGIM
jgi:hypothetical protein